MTTPPPPSPKSKIGIISMGDMGSGLARLLIAHGYHVSTNTTGRSQDTIDRALAAGVTLLPTDTSLITQTSLILSVVPPKDALPTAQRILTALTSLPSPRPPNNPLYFADLNAISPSTVRTISSLFSSLPPSTLRFIDGSILGGPPSPPKDSPTNPNHPWTRPLIPTSGPYPLPTPELSTLLRNTHITSTIGSASGLKMCFASLSKGYAAIAIQSVTTAHRLGVLDHLKDSLRQLAPAQLARMEDAVTGMPPKAYRWVKEMEEICETHAADGGFEDERIFVGAAGIFKFVAEETVLGAEKVAVVGGESADGGKGGNKRVRGTTSEDVARCMAEGLEERERKRRKKE